MNESPTQPPSLRKRRWPRILLAILLVLVLVYGIYRYTLHRMVETRLEAIRKVGFPVTLDELDAWYTQPPPGENAADILTNAFASFASWPTNMLQQLPLVGETRLLMRNESLTEEKKRLIAEYLADNQDAIRFLHQGAMKEQCRYPIRLTEGMSLKQPHLRDIRHGVRLLCLEASFHVDENHTEEAVESIIAAMGMARSLRQEPHFLSQGVRISCQQIVLLTLERILNRAQMTDSQLTSLAKTLVNAEYPAWMLRAAVGELCDRDDVFKTFPYGIRTVSEQDAKSAHQGVLLYKMVGLFDVDRLYCLDVCCNYIEAAQASAIHQVNAFKAPVEKVEHVPRQLVFSRRLVFRADKWPELDFQSKAALRTALTALAVDRYRLALGDLPQQLGDVVPGFLTAVPVDPFNDKPLRYKKLSKGFVVYSVGEDGQDDGGTEETASGQRFRPGTDITFTVER